MKEIHKKYLDSFGTKRYQDFQFWLLAYCMDNFNIVPTYEQFCNLEEFLEEYNLWYTLYLYNA